MYDPSFRARMRLHVLDSLGIIALFILLFLALAQGVSCANKGETKALAKDILCAIPLETHMAATCPTLTEESWEKAQLCLAAAKAAHEARMQVCAGLEDD